MFDERQVDREIELFIFDIYIAVLKIRHVVAKFGSAQELLHSFTDWDSVIREFEIIGEASKYLLKESLLDAHYRRVVDFRNSITHGYFGIDENIVWGIVRQKLDEIEDVILELINGLNPTQKQELIESFIEDNKYLDFVVTALGRLK